VESNSKLLIWCSITLEHQMHNKHMPITINFVIIIYTIDTCTSPSHQTQQFFSLYTSLNPKTLNLNVYVTINHFHNLLKKNKGLNMCREKMMEYGPWGWWISGTWTLVCYYKGLGFKPIVSFATWFDWGTIDSLFMGVLFLLKNISVNFTKKLYIVI